MRRVPLNVTVFATNGRGIGESVSEVVYVEEDGMCKCIVKEFVNKFHFYSSCSSK